jgi:peptide/nickel transport system substrate-binding protein
MKRSGLKVIALLAVVAIVAAACGGDDEGGEPTGATAATAATGATGEVRGGAIVVGAEQWPECINILVTACASLSWAQQSVFVHMTSKAVEIDLEGNLVPGPLITEIPSIEAGTVTEDPFTVTYSLNPDAVWADGTPITCDDWAFTWAAFLNTKGTYYTAGYDQIESVDCPDPLTTVLNFKAPFADWAFLFGGAFEFVMEKAAFPDADPEKPDLSNDMVDGLPFSGGPWVLESWSVEQAVLVPNTNYWVEDRIPLLDQVTMIPIVDQAAEINALLNREAAAINPQASDVSVPDQLAGDPGVTSSGGSIPYNDMMWFSDDNPPLDDPEVREALLFALNREAVLDALIKLNAPEAEIVNCILYLPGLGPWCTPVFADVSYDPAHSVEVLEADGWDCSGVPDSPCTKDGQPLVLTISANSGNTRREASQQIFKEGAKPAGFQLEIENYGPGVYFGRVCPRGLVHVCDYASGGNPGVSLATTSFQCAYIPSVENEFAGGNWNHYCSEEADAVMNQLQAELDPAVQAELMAQLQQIFRDDAMSLPMYVLPTVMAWRSDTIAGPVDLYANHIYSPYFNMFDWYVAQA